MAMSLISCSFQNFRYDKSFSYWLRVPATSDGVLGGFINVAPSVSETLLLEELPHFSYCLICLQDIVESRAFLTALARQGVAGGGPDSRWSCIPAENALQSLGF
jgi:hypothetical protein